jgi:folylpolyglutamate synthase/dihydropteroate synthase
LVKKFAKINNLKVPVIATDGIADALNKGLSSIKNGSPLVITGSFYVASEALSELKKLVY